MPRQTSTRTSDFLKAFKDNGSRLDRNLLIDLASRAHRNARKEFEAFLADVEAGRPIRI